jgi:hypothetical protein
MARNPQTTTASLFTQVQISPAGQSSQSIDVSERGEQTRLMREMLAAQDRQNELLEELVGLMGQAHRQRTQELEHWKQANPKLAQNCRMAAETLGKVQTEFLVALTSEVNDNADALADSDYMLNEFVDRFGPRLAHLNGVLQVLSHLSMAEAAPAADPLQ